MSPDRPPTPLPSARAQAFPRAVRLAPGGLPAPAGALRALISRTKRLDLEFSGWCLEPWLSHGTRFSVQADSEPRPGDLVLCEAEGLADVRRVLGRAPQEGWLTALDSFPPGREVVAPSALIGVIRGSRGAGGCVGRWIALCFPIWSRWASLRYWIRKIEVAPDPGEGAAETVRAKYEQQVEGYRRLQTIAPAAEFLSGLASHLPPGGSVLVAGCGAGREAIHLARAGYTVTAFDFAPAMVAEARDQAAAAGVRIECLQADMTTLDLPGRVFDGAYLTPLLYSFVPGRERRIETLRRIGRHLAPGARVIFTAHMLRGALELARALLVWIRREISGCRSHELGDWFTWFITPSVGIGTAFSRRFLSCQVRREVREAGYRLLLTGPRGTFVAGGFSR